jgi:hypothetical protein
MLQIFTSEQTLQVQTPLTQLTGLRKMALLSLLHLPGQTTGTFMQDQPSRLAQL